MTEKQRWPRVYRMCVIGYGVAIFLYVIATLTGGGHGSAMNMVPPSTRAVSRKVNMELLQNRIEEGRLSDREALYWTTEPFDSLNCARPARR